MYYSRITYVFVITVAGHVDHVSLLEVTHGLADLVGLFVGAVDGGDREVARAL